MNSIVLSLLMRFTVGITPLEYDNFEKASGTVTHRFERIDYNTSMLISVGWNCDEGYWLNNFFEDPEDCFALLISDKSCSSEFFVIGSTDGNCKCITKGTNCLDSTTRRRHRGMLLFQNKKYLPINSVALSSSIEISSVGTDVILKGLLLMSASWIHCYLRYNWKYLIFIVFFLVMMLFDAPLAHSIVSRHSKNTAERCILVAGAQGSGTKLVTNLIASGFHKDLDMALNHQQNIGSFSNPPLILHRSLPHGGNRWPIANFYSGTDMLNPYGAKGNYYVDSISMKQACATANFDFEVIFISRDTAITERSGVKHTKSQLEEINQLRHARKVIQRDLDNPELKTLLLSYEILMSFPKTEIARLEEFLGLALGSIKGIDIIDGNRKYVQD